MAIIKNAVDIALQATLPRVITATFYTLGAPTNNPVPTAISVLTNADGTADVTISWTYTNGALVSDGFYLGYVAGTGALTNTNCSYISLSPNTLSYTFLGVSQANTYRAGIAAYRNTISGIYTGTIVQPISAPDWRYIGAVPNITATIAGAAAANVAAAVVTANNVNGTLNTFLSDGTLSLTELQSIRGWWDSTIAEQSSINAQAVSFGLTALNAAYNAALVAVGTFMNGSVWTTGIPYYITTVYIGTITNTGLSISATTGADFRAVVSLFEIARTAVFQGISDKAATKADWSGVTGTVPSTILNSNVTTTSIGAATTAAVTAAQNAADSANTWLTSALSDGVLTVSELQSIRSWWDNTIAEQTSINAQVTAFTLTSLGSSYTTAIYNLGYFMNGNVAWTVGTMPSYIATTYINSATLTTPGLNIGATTGRDFRSLVATFGVARTAIFNAVSNAAATTANWSGVTGTVPSTILNSNITIASDRAPTFISIDNVLSASQAAINFSLVNTGVVATSWLWTAYIDGSTTAIATTSTLSTYTVTQENWVSLGAGVKSLKVVCVVNGVSSLTNFVTITRLDNSTAASGATVNNGAFANLPGALTPANYSSYIAAQTVSKMAYILNKAGGSTCATSLNVDSDGKNVLVTVMGVLKGSHAETFGGSSFMYMKLTVGGVVHTDINDLCVVISPSTSNADAIYAALIPISYTISISTPGTGSVNYTLDLTYSQGGNGIGGFVTWAALQITGLKV